MSRLVLPLAICLAAWGANATADAPGRIEMDVLELHEPPAQAVRRMDQAQQRAAARRQGPTEHPQPSAYVPEELLGDRGLLGPVEPPAAELEQLREDLRERLHEERHRIKDQHKGPGGK